MAEIYQLPEGSSGGGAGGGIPFSIPLGGNNGGLFGNGGGNSLADLFGFAIIAAMFGWNNGGISSAAGRTATPPTSRASSPTTRAARWSCRP